MAGGIAKHIPGIDNVIIADVPWVKTKKNEGAAGYLKVVEHLRRQNFDAAVIFTVFSQNPLPAVMLAYLAGIPCRLAYCRENPYELLTHWVPDKEPYTSIAHQVSRDLALVGHVGATTKNQALGLKVPNTAYAGMMQKMKTAGVDTDKPWIIVHPGASETKRLFPLVQFNQILQKIIEQSPATLVITGTQNEKLIAHHLCTGLGDRAVSMVGSFSLEEFMALIDIAPLVLSVNTGTVHIAAALHTPVVVLYALTNPQHTPWNVPSRIFPFAIDDDLKSRNEILRYLHDHVMEKPEKLPDPEEVAQCVIKLSQSAHQRHA
jgi:ADP-heptose:LPS heptosyltransferase